MNTETKTIKDVMTAKVELVKPDAKLIEIAQKMQERDCGSILIGENDRLVGVVTDRDITLRAVAKGLDPATTTAKQVMSTKVLYCMETDSVDSVAQNMARNQVRRLAVLNAQKRMVGVVSLGDVANAGSAKAGSALGQICGAPVSKAA